MTRTVRLSLSGFAVGLLVMVIFLQIGGGAPEPSPLGIPDPGLLVGWALPAMTFLTQVSGVVVVGFLVAAVFLLPSSKDVVEGLSVSAVTLASRWAGVWSIASILVFVLTVSDVFARPLTDLSFSLVTSLAFDSSLGRALLVQALTAAIIAVACRWTIGIRPLAIWLGVTLAALLPVSLTGHSASSASHDLALTSLFLHVVGVSVWVGGLAALGWVALRGSKRLPDAISRFSTLALWAIVVVAASGVANASVRLVGWDDIVRSSYGRLVVAKVVALALLATIGWRQRRRIVTQGKGFLTLAVTELLLMTATIGLAVALSRTPTPASDVVTTRSEELIGGAMPPAPTVAHVAWGWEPTGVALAVVGLGFALYVKGLLVLRHRGDAWPAGRTVSWMIGLALIAWAGIGGLSQYAHVLFSAHMVSHMVLSMVAPIFLVLAAPVTLALRTLPGPRQPGEVSPRGLLTSFLGSGFARIVTHPLVGPALFVGSLYGLYFSPVFGELMDSHWGHAAMQLHFIAVGTLFFYVLVGVDPSPRSLQPLVRFGLLLVTIPFHAFFAIAVMSSNRVIAESYWTTIDRPFRTDLLADQYLGGGISWAMGEIPLVLVLGALFVQWIRSDRREARRLDRAADRDDDAELQAYNAYLRDLAENGRRRDP
ncbi:cytochrome c oxidase assembly protein [Aeromicrobium sp.]|uniref:cytochrome c oxidase assembly protein n=1 Tax=Aeromicrobium sp. TaxID=1871063 RepID=UPI003C514D06